MKKIVAGLMSVVFVAVCASAAPQVVDKPVVDRAASQAVSKTVVDKTLAVVNSKPILESEFNSYLEQYRQFNSALNQPVQEETKLKDDVLNNMIEFILLKQEVSNQKIKVSKKELQDRVSEVKREFPNESQFVASLADIEKTLREVIVMEKFIEQFVDSKVKTPSEIEVKDIYDKIVMKMKGTKTSLSPEEDTLVSSLVENIKRMTAEQVRLRQIFVKCPKDANETTLKAAQLKIATIKKELQKQTFADIVAQYSEDSVSKAINGGLGIVTKGDLAPSINEVVFSMKVGDYTKDPIRADSGYYFIKVEEKHAKKDITFANVKNFVSHTLHTYNKKKALRDYTNTLKSKASIKINKTW